MEGEETCYLEDISCSRLWGADSGLCPTPTPTEWGWGGGSVCFLNTYLARHLKCY